MNHHRPRYPGMFVPMILKTANKLRCLAFKMVLSFFTKHYFKLKVLDDVTLSIY